MLTNASTQFLSRGIDYLGDLAAKLRDLRGFATLAHELIQNADDVASVSAISFDITRDALIVSNDASFTDCGRIEESECPWKDEPSKGYRCDFHRFRFVASGDKRHQPETTGAFGVGFIAVYQITDTPELISGGRHWYLHEDRPENQRIEICSGCPKCHTTIASTVFYLPWARDSQSTLRKELSAEAVSDQTIAELYDELCRSMPMAVLFLKRLNRIDIRRHGCDVRKMERVNEANSVILSDGTKDCIWHLFEGQFQVEAATLREEHGNRIEKKRSSRVALAIPTSSDSNGLLCATLPTQHATGLGFHINADFFTPSDRKGVIFESDYQSEWNRAAIRAAARLFADKVQQVSRQVGHRQLWATIDSIQRVAEETASGRHDPSFAEFANALRPRLSTEPILFTTDGKWCSAPDAVLLYEKREAEAIPILEKLGIAVVHDDLRPYHNRLRSKEVGVALLDIHHIVDALRAIPLAQRTEIRSLPPLLQADSALRQLWREVSALLGRPRGPKEQCDAELKLGECAIALGSDGALWPCNKLFRTDPETQVLFNSILPGLPFVADMGEDGVALAHLCPPFTAEDAIGSIEHGGTTKLQQLFRSGHSQLRTLLRWFEKAGPLNDAVRRRIAALPLFPSSNQLRPLTELVLPGDFTDPIGLAGLVDLTRIDNRRDFLLDLGAKELTLETYVTNSVPLAFQSRDLMPEKKRAVVVLLASRLGELRDASTVKKSLSDVELVECDDGCFRNAASTYFPGQVVDDVLGDEPPRALLPDEHLGSVEELYRWLGVAVEPRVSDIIARVDALVADAPNTDSISRIQAVFRHLGSRVKGEQNRLQVEELKDKSWLPARGEYSRWYKPAELYASFQAYLFESQAKFLDIPDADQRTSTELLSFLRVEQSPSIAQVVNHLIDCATAGRVVNKEVYRFLNDKADELPITRLRDFACLLISENQYVKPCHVYWGEHPFGRFRHRLSQNLRRYNDLFSRLGVREVPNYESALEVLEEIQGDYPSRALDDEAYAALIACWRMLEHALDAGDLADSSIANVAKGKVIPNAKHVLCPPDWVFFEDVPGLAAKFGSFLDNNVIARSPGAWRAMAAVGVRSLSDAVVTSLAECEDPSRAESLELAMTERRAQLARVLEAHSSGLADRLERLSPLKAHSVSNLAVQYKLHAFDRDVTSEAEEVQAHYHRESNELYFVPQNGRPPWNSIARELALLLCPGIEPGRLAPGIKEVLSADTTEQARLVLDELGCPGLEAPPLQSAAEAELVEDLGGEALPDQPPPVSQPPPPPTIKTLGPSELGTSSDQPHREEQALDALPGGDRLSPSSLPREVQRIDSSASGGGTRGDVASRGGRKTLGSVGDGKGTPADRPKTHPDPGGRLRTYVTPDGDGDGSVGEDLQQQATRTVIEKAAVARVIEYERMKGRHPVEMPPLHKGYDIESRESQGGPVVRYIEVKGRASEWGSLGVGLTRSQFAMAATLGDLYWLYVVECAEEEDVRIFRIQNPARRVNQFLYDDGWRVLSEEHASHGLKEISEHDREESNHKA